MSVNRSVHITTKNASNKSVTKTFNHYNPAQTDTDIKVFATNINMLSSNKLTKVSYTDKENITNATKPVSVSFSFDTFDTTFWSDATAAFEAGKYEKPMIGAVTNGSIDNKTGNAFSIRAKADSADSTEYISLTFDQIRSVLNQSNPSKAFAETLSSAFETNNVALAVSYENKTFTVTNTGGGDIVYLYINSDTQRYDNYFVKILYDKWNVSGYPANVAIETEQIPGSDCIYYYLTIDSNGGI